MARMANTVGYKLQGGMHYRVGQCRHCRALIKTGVRGAHSGDVDTLPGVSFDTLRPAGDRAYRLCDGCVV